jgi:uroporphyrinogen-III decarboxylase
MLNQIGPEGFIMAQACAIPPGSQFENVKAMVDSVQRQ